jgi:AraC-like DNA-binding protein/mannose-6-phosphate isomerase-like protein (cupin superfamily)
LIFSGHFIVPLRFFGNLSWADRQKLVWRRVWGYAAASGIHDGSSEMTQDFGMSAARNDVLSEVLTLIRLRGELVYTAFLGEPWGLQFQPGPAHFHFIEKGEAWVTPAGERPKRVIEGDLVLLPLGKGHVIADALGSPVENIGIVAASHFDREELVLRHGGDGPVTRLVGGFFSFEGSPLPAVMSALPPLIHIPRGDAGAPPWLAAISHFLVAEAQQPNPGSSLMISRLIDLLVIRTLRSWAASEANRMGWLGGLGEERIGRVLSAMHADPFRRWTVQSLAEVARMSRSIFAERFTSAVGEPPLRYLSRWRLTIAADLLRSGGLKVTEAAYRSGYASDAAFSRAFKAHFGYAPSEARAQQLP